MTKITKSYRIVTVLPPPDSQPPILLIQQPTPGAIVALNSTQPLTVSGNAADVGSGLDYSEVSVDSGPFVKATGTTSWAANINNVLSGNHTARARARDKAGNLSAERSVFFSVTKTVILPPPPPPVVPPPPPPTGGTTWIPWTPTGPRIDATSVSSIQAAINSLKPLGGTVHIPPGTFSIPAAGIQLGGVNNIVFEGSGRTPGPTGTHLVCNADRGAILVKSGSTKTTNVTIRNIDIDGANRSKKIINFVNTGNLLFDNVLLQRHNEGWPDPVTGNETGPGVYIEELDGGLVQNCLISNPSGPGDAFAIGGYRLTFRNNEVVRTAYQGGGFTSGGLADSFILNNNFHDFKGYSATSLENFHIRADSVHSFKNIEIAYNTYKNLSGGGGSNAISSLGYASGGKWALLGKGTFYNINVHHNVIENATGGIRLNATDMQPNVVTYNSRIANNTLTNTAGIMAGPLKTCRIDDNTVNHTDYYRGNGIYLYAGCSGVQMDGNKLTDIKPGRTPYSYVGSSDIFINGAKVA